MYEYNAVITSVYDGDTATCTLDLGFGIHITKAKLRLHGINTAELRGGTAEEKERGYAARDWLRDQIMDKKVRVRSKKKGKYGRYLAVIWQLDSKGEVVGDSLNDRLIELGHATAYLV